MCVDNLTKSVNKRKVKKANRLVTYFFSIPSLRKRNLWRTEMTLTEQDIDDYIESLMNNQANDTKVANTLLKWLEQKKKYSQVDANTTAELDMEMFMKRAESIDKSDQPEVKTEVHTPAEK